MSFPSDLDSLLSEAASMVLTPLSAASPPGFAPPVTRMGGVVGALAPPGTLVSKLYPVVSVSGVDSSVCFGVVGAGSASFCIRNKCTVKSHADAKVDFAGRNEERVFICRKVNNSVFAQPSIALDRVPSDVWKEWSSKTTSLPGWVREFDAVDITDDVFATTSDVKIQKRALKDAVEVFKTPAKRKREMLLGEPLADWTVVNHTRSLPFDESSELEAVILSGMGRGILTKIVAKLETSAVTLGDAMEEVALLSHTRFLSNEEGINSISGVVQNLKSSVGMPVQLDDRFEAPTLWGAVAFIADEVSRIGLTLLHVNEEIKEVKASVAEVIGVINERKTGGSEDSEKMLKVLTMVMTRVKGIAPEMSMLSSRVGTLEAKAEALFSTKKRRGENEGDGRLGEKDAMDDLMMMLDNNELDSESQMVTPEKGSKSLEDSESFEFARDIRRLDFTIENLIADVGLLKSCAEDKSVKFGGLGLRSINECHSWMETHFRGYRYGLIMDPLLMLDRIFGSDDVEADSQFKILEARVKLKITTGAEAAAIKALHFKRPRLFHKGRIAMTSERNKSKLSKLPNFEAWKGGGEGVRNYVVKQMNLIHGTLSHDIAYAFGNDSSMVQAQSLAVMSLNATITFLTQLMGFVDTIYEKLHLYSKFTAEQGWSLTTQILDRICEDLFAPKEGVAAAMTVEDPASICAHMLWSCFQTHDVMAKYMEHNFENHPAISAEYVKFLATNSGFDKVEKLESTVASMSEKITKVTAESSGMGKKVEGTGSKIGSIEGLLTALTKRVKAIEDQKGR